MGWVCEHPHFLSLWAKLTMNYETGDDKDMPHTLKRRCGHGDTSRLGSPGILRASRVRADDCEGAGRGWAEGQV